MAATISLPTISYSHSIPPRYAKDSLPEPQYNSGFCVLPSSHDIVFYNSGIYEILGLSGNKWLDSKLVLFYSLEPAKGEHHIPGRHTEGNTDCRTLGKVPLHELCVEDRNTLTTASSSIEQILLETLLPEIREEVENYKERSLWSVGSNLEHYGNAFGFCRLLSSIQDRISNKTLCVLGPQVLPASRTIH